MSKAYEFNQSKCITVQKARIKDLEKENEQLKHDATVLIQSNQDYRKENEQLKKQLARHTRMHEWFRNEAYLLQNKLDNREDEIRRLKGDVE